MTNEEIREKAWGTPNDADAIERAMRELVALAYEEAAKAAENQLGVSGYAYAEDEHELIARYIRSLKDSLVQETAKV
jgi:hypothetical protein